MNRSTCLLITVLLGAATPGLADFKALYVRGLEAVDFERWRDVVVLMDAAIAENPQSGGLVRPYGTWIEPYVPHYYLGLGLFELGRYDKALEMWQEAERQGTIRLPRSRPKLERLIELRAEVPLRIEREAEALRAELRRLAEEIERRSEQALLATRGDEVGLEDVDARLAQVLALKKQLDGTATLPNEQVAAAVVLLETASEQLGALRAQVERQRAAREHERRAERERAERRLETERFTEAEKLLAAGECSRPAIELLRAIVDAGPLPPLEGEPPRSPYLRLAEALRSCGALDGAALYAGLARRDPQTDPDRLSRLEREMTQERLKQEVAAAYEKAEALLATGGCRPEASRLLTGVVERWWRSESPRSQGGWEPARLLAELRRNCGLPAAAPELLRAAAAELAAGTCSPATLARLELLADWFRDQGAAAADLPKGEPFLTLARGHLRCARPGEGAEAIERARRAGAPETEVSALEAALGAAQTAASRRREKVRALADYLAAAAWNRLGECHREPLDLLAHARKVLTAEEATRLLPTMVFEPDQAAETAHRACGHRTADGSATTQGAYSASHALLIAAYDYDEKKGWKKLPGVQKDLAEVEKTLAAHGFEIEPFPNPESDTLERRVRKFIERHGRDPAHRIVIYYAGHGWLEEAFGVRNGYIVPVDAPHPAAEQAGVPAEMISMDVFELEARRILANHALFIFDTCFGGAVFRHTRPYVEPDVASTPIAELANRPVRMFLSAGDETQAVPDDSFFRRTLLRGLGGVADTDGDAFVLGHELTGFVCTEVREKSFTSPRWGVMAEGRLGEGDIIFRSMSGGDRGPAARLRAEIAAFEQAFESQDPALYRGYLELYPAGSFNPLVEKLRAETASAQ